LRSGHPAPRAGTRRPIAPASRSSRSVRITPVAWPARRPLSDAWRHGRGEEAVGHLERDVW